MAIRSKTSRAALQRWLTDLLCVLTALGATGCFGHMHRDGVAPVLERLPELSRQRPTPLWDVPLDKAEVDLAEFISDDRLLVSTADLSWMAWALVPGEVLLLDAATGAPLWRQPRPDRLARLPLQLVARRPVLLLSDGRAYVALDPATGKEVWTREVKGGGIDLLPDGESILFQDRSDSSLVLAAVRLVDGREAWRLEVGDYPAGEVRVRASAMTDRVVVVGPDVLAVSSQGALLWRTKHPGAASSGTAAFVAGSDVFLLDGSSIVRLGQDGLPSWRATAAGKVQGLLPGDQAVFVLIDTEGGADEVVALDARTGTARWRIGLDARARSSLSTDGRRIFVTTSTGLLAVEAKTGSLAYRAPISTALQAGSLLPDILRVEEQRLILVRETGVLAVEKERGTLLYERVIDGAWPYTVAAKTDKLRRGLTSITPLKDVPKLQAAMASQASTFHYQAAVANQEFVYSLTAQVLRTANTAEKPPALYSPVALQVQIGQTQSRFDAGVAMGQALGNLAVAGMAGLDQGARRGRLATLGAEVAQASIGYQSSLNRNLFVRPVYTPERGWSLALIDLVRGDCASIALAPDSVLSRLAPNLPVSAVDDQGGRLVSKGLGTDPAKVSRYNKASMDGWWDVPFPRLLAFDLRSLPFGPSECGAIAQPQHPAPSTRDIDREFLAAAAKADVAGVTRALDAGAGVNAADAQGLTALMLISEEAMHQAQAKKTIELLLKRDADVLIKDPSGLAAVDHLMLGWPSGPGLKGPYLTLFSAMEQEYFKRQKAQQAPR
jgi:outer membrane protein assembly factor BamB